MRHADGGGNGSTYVKNELASTPAACDGLINFMSATPYIGPELEIDEAFESAPYVDDAYTPAQTGRVYGLMMTCGPLRSARLLDLRRRHPPCARRDGGAPWFRALYSETD